MNFIGCIPRFLKAHGGWILTGLGVIGFGATVALTANEAPKAKSEIEDREDELFDNYIHKTCPDGDYSKLPEEYPEEACLTRWQKFKIALPYYIPSIITGTATVGCMIGAQIFNMRQQAMLIGMYATLATQFDQYREAVRAEHGDEADKRAFEISRMKIEELKAEIKRLKEENGPYLYGISTLPGVIFEDKPVNIEESLMHFNRNLVLRGEADFDELYRFIGIPESAYDEKLASSFGYNQYVNDVTYGVGYADFMIQSVFTKDGRPINMIQPVIPPYRVDCCEDDIDDITEETYPDYTEVCRRAFDIAKNFIDSDLLFNKRLTKTVHPVITAGNLYYEF